jgi:hypothetical protein
VATRPCFVAFRPWTTSKVALMPLESVWWYWITLYWLVSHGNDLKLLKFSIFEIFSYYWCLYFILSMITMCETFKTLFNVTYLDENQLAYIALEFWIQLYNFVSWAKILGNVLCRCWRCDITVFTLSLKSCCLLVIHLSSLPFPNLKLTYTPPRAKYEWKDLLYHAYTFVEFLQMLIL